MTTTNKNKITPEERILEEHYNTTLNVLEDYADQFASSGPTYLLEGLNSLHGAITTIQVAMARTYRSEWVKKADCE
jgi:hypothetical protein